MGSFRAWTCQPDLIGPSPKISSRVVTGQTGRGPTKEEEEVTGGEVQQTFEGTTAGDAGRDDGSVTVVDP